MKVVAGVDEAGRGPLAGPVIAAAVILDGPIFGLDDSKKLTERKRERLYDEIHQHALAVAVGRAEAAEIDQLNILQASLLAMQRAVEGLAIRPQHVLVDGKFCPSLNMGCEAIIKGDQKEACIAAASIVAKVTRDREMVELDQQFPAYGFAQHKGYPTKAHLAALVEHGVSPLHRTSFAPVQNILASVLA